MGMLTHQRIRVGCLDYGMGLRLTESIAQKVIRQQIADGFHLMRTEIGEQGHIEEYEAERSAQKMRSYASASSREGRDDGKGLSVLRSGRTGAIR